MRLTRTCCRCKTPQHPAAFSGKASWCKKCSAEHGLAKYHEAMRSRSYRKAKSKAALDRYYAKKTPRCVRFTRPE